ncbi:MAG: hypothetical protein C0617_01700 [Desulfuromonas sp.]|uniref:OadG family transporter subunit n=1 Tax=Desulfuromonas sp. TaxID=892 RepID=UPI000CAE8A3E|nr:OadG family transporter subunit [Desulfuromonas sp.]PLX86317.1 MAG: hypothetical protein C0617_01700 [Desulfuromonas sp.]
MNNLTMGFENIINANGVTIAVTGIIIVFSALTIISLFIALLPKLLPLLGRLLPEEQHPHAPSPSQSSDHEEILAAIAHALFRKQAGSLPTK